MNRKGASVTDLFLVIIVLFAFTIASILAYKIFTDVNDDFQSSESFTAPQKAMIQGNKDRFVGIFDGLILFLVVGLTVALIVGASMVNTHPALFIVALFLTALVILGGAIFSNVYEEFAANAQVSTVESEFTLAPYVMGNLPVILTVIASIVMLVLYAKTRGEE